MKNIGLYIHIPFCSGKCPYCDFYSVKADETAYDEYTKNMIKKITSLSGKYHADTVYLGGGTPSLIGTDRIAAILGACREAMGSSDEITAEVNPRSAMQLDFKKLKAHGLNRVSMGLQSASDSELMLLGRRHSKIDAANAVKKIQESGIYNISLDLMLGIGGQTSESLKSSIDFCSSLDVQHISAYILKIEEGTPYYKMKNKLPLPNDDEVCDLYESAAELLSEYGFKQYEISNFSKEGKESRHNLKYWRCEEYLGLGPAAHSFIDGKRFYYCRSINDFYDDITTSDGSGGDREEYIALALRLTEGLIYESYLRRFGEPLPDRFIKNAERLTCTGLLSVTPNNISLTPKGFLCSNSVIAEILYG